MNIIFFIKSNTITIDKYNIKNIPGSSGRLDVISRCILATLIKNDCFEKNVQIWVFLDNFGTLVFNPKFFSYDKFPKKELCFTDCLVGFLQKSSHENHSLNPLSSLKQSKKSILEAIMHFQKLNYSIYILKEQGRDFYTLLDSIQGQKNIIFILGSQNDEYLNSEELVTLKIPTISLGNQSYLASSTIRLLKLHLLDL
jgi:tRNA (pseudouridine54-N1)-methyltransferase